MVSEPVADLDRLLELAAQTFRPVRLVLHVAEEAAERVCVPPGDLRRRLMQLDTWLEVASEDQPQGQLHHLQLVHDLRGYRAPSPARKPDP